jgi:hypothetical protein
VKSFLCALALFGILCVSTRALARESGPFGVGLILGEPTALNFKYDQTQNDAFDAGLAFNLDKWLLVYGDYQY